jgi:hypothetical protein
MTPIAPQTHDAVRAYLEKARDVTRFTTQNGWPDNETLRFEVLDAAPDELTVAVEFEEVIMEGAGCVAGRQPCYGRMRLTLDAEGRVIGGEPLE